MSEEYFKIILGMIVISDKLIQNKGESETYIGDSVTKIGAWAFSSCSSLKKVIIGKSISLIDQDAFSNCEELETLVITAEKAPRIIEGALKKISSVTGKRLLLDKLKSIQVVESAIELYYKQEEIQNYNIEAIKQ